MPYLTGPYAAHSSLPSPATNALHSSRSINATTRRYELDDDGNPEQMPSTRQRVLLRLDFGTGQPPKLISDTGNEQRRKQIIAALQPLVDEGSIRLDSVAVEQTRAGVVEERIDYTDLATGTDDTVTRTQ